MDRNAVIFGTGSFADVVKFYLEADSDYRVAGFVASADAVTADTHLGLPLATFEAVEATFPPNDFDMFVAIGYRRLNSVREKFADAAIAKGYHLLSYVCSKATHWGDTAIGSNVFVFENNVIQPFVTIGDGSILWSGNHIGHHSTIERYCFITSHVVVSGHCRVGAYSFLGVNSTIADDTSIGERNIVGPGALIQKDTSPDEVYVAERTKKFPKDSSRFFR